MDHRQVSSGQKALMITVVIGTILIACIGFVGSYNAVLHLAQHNGFGWFSYVLPIGIDVGITVFLALDLLLTWMRIPLPILRQLAWVLTGATIVFNAASAWPNPLSSGMHAVVPLLFVAAIEAARHTVGKIAQIEANQLFERTRLGRWIWAPLATLRLFRRRMLWELRSYEEALEMERRRLVYRARLRATYGRLWRHRAPVDFILMLKLANLGEPLPEFKLENVPVLPAPAMVAPEPLGVTAAIPGPREEASVEQGSDNPVITLASAGELSGHAAQTDQQISAPAPAQRGESTSEPKGTLAASGVEPDAEPGPPAIEAETASPLRQPQPATKPSTGSAVDRYRTAFADYTQQHGIFPDGDQLAKWLFEQYGVAGRSGEALSSGHLRRYLPGFKEAWESDQEAMLSAPQ